MIPTWVTDNLLATILLALIVVPLLWVILKALLWWIFSFEPRIQKILSQKKSSEVRLGRITEQLSPLHEDFPVDIKKPGTQTVFIGQPVDFIHFDSEEGVTFIEVKSGGAKLTPFQKQLKALIEQGKVRWESFRVR
jgi:predicted Holliday junction resolvase-like endonuclease